MHAINNLIGKNKYKTDDLNNICLSLSSDFINPYKSVFGGDFDVTALICALEREKLRVRWLKKY